MDKIEKIRQEIERRINILTNVYAEQMERNDEEMMNYYHGKVIALEELLTFLDTLSEEPDKSLEEAAYKYSFDSRPSVYGQVDVIDAFKAGAEWQKQQMLKDAVEGKVFMSFAPGHNQMVMADVDLPTNTKVRIVVLKAEEGGE